MMESLAFLLDRAERECAHRIAIIDGDVRSNYCDTIRRARQLATGLGTGSTKPVERVAVLDHNSKMVLELYFACALSGVTIVPLNFRLAARELQKILEEADVQVLVVGEPFVELVAQLNLEVAVILPSHYESLIASSSPCKSRYEGRAEVSAIYYTSGTSGEPKGVCLRESGLLAGVTDALYTLTLQPNDVWLHAAPLFHLADACAIWATVCVGAAHAVIHFEPTRFLSMVESAKVTCTSIPPTLINMIADLPVARTANLSSLRRISFGGSPMPEGVFDKAKAVFNCEMFQAYGITEVAGFVCVGLPGDELAPHLIIGRAVPSLDVIVLRDDGSQADPDEVGEIAVRGPKVMMGYWKKPETTKGAIVNGWYHTGDLGSRATNGLFSIRGRKKDMIITGGENVYAAEVEESLIAHPSVLEAAVFGLPDPKWGEAVHAVVTVREGVEVTPQDLIEWCRSQIAGYKVPKWITVSSAPLPKSGPGKIAKHVIKSRMQAGWSDGVKNVEHIAGQRSDFLQTR